MPDPFARSPTERFLLIIDLLCRALGGRVTRPGRPGLPDALLVLIWRRLRRVAGRFTRLAARIEAGIPPAPRRQRAPRRNLPAAPSPPNPSPPEPSPPNPSPLRLPRDRGWLIRLVPYDAAGGASQLQYLLSEPEMAPLLADPRMGRLLRPLCHMLGLERPPDIATPKPAPVAPANPPSLLTPPPASLAATPPAAPRPRPAAALPRRRPSACGPPPVPA